MQSTLYALWETYICGNPVEEEGILQDVLWKTMLASTRELWEIWNPELLQQSTGTYTTIYHEMCTLGMRCKDTPLELRDWISWPTVIKKTGMYQCAGAALLAMVLLEQWNIPYMVANPVGHVVIMGRTEIPNTWWYLDGTPGKEYYIEVHAEEIMIGKNTVLQLDDTTSIPFRRIPLYPPEMISGLIMDNIQLACNAYDRGVFADIPEALISLAPLMSFPWSAWYSEYFGERVQINEHPYMRAEQERIRALYYTPLRHIRL